MRNVSVSGAMTDATSGVNLSSVNFKVTDEYGAVQPAGAVLLGAGGSFRFLISLQAARSGNDRDGRRYKIAVSAEDNAGNAGSATALASVPHDRR
jgi:hypothetical protein